MRSKTPALDQNIRAIDAETQSESSVTAKPKSKIAQKNETRIIQAAQEIFAQYGLHGATMDRVAQSCGMSKANLHYYFTTKTDLYVAVLRHILDIWQGSMERLDPAGDPETELSGYISEKIELARTHPFASRVFASEILAGAPMLQDYLAKDLRLFTYAKAEAIQAWIRAGKIAPVDPMHLIFLIWSATQHYADFLPQILAITGKSELAQSDYEAVRVSLTQILLKGILLEGPTG